MSEEVEEPIRVALRRVLESEVLEATEMEAAMTAILSGGAPPALVAGLAIALRMRGEHACELAAAARVLRKVAGVTLASSTLVDTCGTGGDGSGTFNVSTATAVVLAACGVPVAKHGNRAVSSRAGSADVLHALGISLETTREENARHLAEFRIAFYFAPRHHSALRYVASLRRELGVRTFFNLLGPLANPAGATHQLLGVYAEDRGVLMAEVLRELGVAGWVVHGEGGLDEITPAGETRVWSVSEQGVRVFSIAPEDFGLERCALEELAGGDAEQNASLIRALLDGEHSGRRTAVLINAAGALVASGAETDLRAARERAAAAIDRGDARKLLLAWASGVRRAEEPLAETAQR